MKRLFVPSLAGLIGLSSAGIFGFALALTLNDGGSSGEDIHPPTKEVRIASPSREEGTRLRISENLKKRGTQLMPYPELPLGARPISIETGLADYSAEEVFCRKQVVSTLAERDPFSEERKSEFEWIHTEVESLTITGWIGNVEEVEITDAGYVAVIKIKPYIASRSHHGFIRIGDYCLETWSCDGEILSFVSRKYPEKREKTMMTIRG